MFYRYFLDNEVPTLKIRIELDSGISVTEYHAEIGNDPHMKPSAPGSYLDIQYSAEDELWYLEDTFTYTHGENILDSQINLADPEEDGIWVILHLVACHFVPI